MGAIFFKQFATGSAPYLTLSREEYVRPLGIGTDWTSLRISILCSVTPTDAGSPATITNVDFFLGLCNMGGGSYAGSLCANAVGISQGVGLDGTWTYTAGSPGYWSTPALNTTTRISGVTARNGSNNSFIFGTSLGRRWVFTVIITKAGIISSSSCPVSSPDWQTLNFLDSMDSSVYNSVVLVSGTSVTLVGQANQSISLSEASGVLNAINIFWNKTAPLEIYAIAVARIS